VRSKRVGDVFNFFNQDLSIPAVKAGGAGGEPVTARLPALLEDSKGR
jgi:hypothetical protein